MTNKPDTPPVSPAVRKFLSAIGKKGGRVASAKKAKSSAVNGKKGGRPRTLERRKLEAIVQETVERIVAEHARRTGAGR